MKNNLIILGRMIGTHTGWDHVDTASFIFYDFEPVSEFNGSLIAQGSIYVDYDLGKIEAYDDDGKVTYTIDIIEAIQNCNKVQDNS